MKEKTTDTEGHQIKVGQDQHKPFASPANPSSKPFATSSSPVKNIKESSSSKANTSGLSPANNNNNFDDDYNEWDISIGDLIIDLDADIERQSEGDKSVSEGKPSEPLKPTGSLRNSPGELAKPPTVMSSSFKSSRMILSSASANATSSTTGTNSNPVPASSIVSSTNGGSTSVHLHRHSHGQSNNQRNYPVPNTGANSSLVKPVATVSANSSQVEHQAKGLKMKIKRKSVGGKVSEINHEIVSSDTSPPSCKSYITSFEHASNTVNPSIVAPTGALIGPSQASVLGPSTAPPTTNTTLTINATNSVITANADGVSTPSDDLLFSSKSSKHSSKNKSGHRDKKDKTRLDKDRFNLSLNSSPLKTKSEDDSAVSPTLTNTQTNIPNLTLKYSPSSAVIIKSDDINNKTVNNVKKNMVEDSISDRQDVGTMTSIGTITEPDCLGPCEPGTSVTLEGIVWQETDNGILVVNITWRGKTYVGTLLDCTKHDWAPPRLCDSPTSDIESKSLKNTRGKRARGCFADAAIDTRSVTSKLRNGKGRRTANSGYIPSSPAKSDSLNANKRKNRPADLELNVEDSGKRTKMSTVEIQPDSPTYIICPEPNCSKKYRTGNGLKYHQSHAHVGSSCVNDSQDFEASGTEGAKGDASDNEFNDSMPHSPLKTIPSDKTKGEICKFKSINSDDCKLEDNSDNGNSANVEAKQLTKINADESLESNHTNSIVGETELNVNASNLKLSGLKCSKDKSSDVGQNKVMDGEVGLANESSLTGLKEANTEESTEQSVPVNCNKFTMDSELEKVASPAYSDISDDNNTNDNTSELLNLASAQIEKSAAESPATLEKSAGALSNFPLAPFPSYSFGPKKLTEAQETPLNSDSVTDNQPFPYPNRLYRFCDTKFSENSNNRSATCTSPTHKLEGDGFPNKDSKTVKENAEFVNNNKEPIAELQNLKNRIQNFAFDQGSLYDGQKSKFPLEIEKERLKEKTKHSPPHPIKPLKEAREEKERSKMDEGVKPTMETTGPPPPTNGYYYNPSFLPHPYAPLSAHFDPMFRGTAMNHMVMGGAYGPGPGSPFIPSPMRYPQVPPMGSLEGLPLQPNVSRPSVSSPSTSSSIAKTSVHHHHVSKHSDRPGLLSPITSVPTCLPTSSSHSSSISSYHKSPSKEFPSGLGAIPTSLPVATSASEARSLPISSAVSTAMHQPPPRHPLQASHLPYPMYDPFHAMIHTSNSVPMHPFTPK